MYYDALMQIETRKSALPILGVFLFAVMAVWLMVMFLSNENPTGFRHYNFFEGLRYYQHMFLPGVDNVGNVDQVSGYYWGGASFAGVFGAGFRSLMAINLFSLLLIIIGAYWLGAQFGDRQTGLICALTTGTMPAVFGMSFAYEGAIGEMACLVWFAVVFVWWTKKGGLWRLVLALCIACLATVTGTQNTMKALMQVHLAAVMAAFGGYEIISRIKQRGGVDRGVFKIIGGAILVGTAGLFLLLAITQWGRTFSYQFNVLEHAANSDRIRWSAHLVYYPFNLLFRFISENALIVMAVGMIVGRPKWSAVLAFAVWALLPAAFLLAIKWPDAAYILASAPAMGIIVGFCAQGLVVRHRYTASLALLLLCLITYNAFLGAFEGRGSSVRIDALAMLADYQFQEGVRISDEVASFDRMATCVAKNAGDHPPGRVIPMPAVIAPVGADFEKFRARIMMAHPKIYPLNPADEVLYYLEDPTASDYAFFAVALDEDTAGKRNFREMARVWADRAASENVKNRLVVLADAKGTYTRTGTGCGMAFFVYDREKSDNGQPTPLLGGDF